MLGEFTSLALDVWRQGGFVMWFLGPVALLMWYGIGVRIWLLRRGSRKSLRDLVAAQRAGTKRTPHGVIDRAVRAALAVNLRHGHAHHRLQHALSEARDDLGSWSKVVTGAAIVAPLAGLLGTVTGMITTFDALGSGSMHAVGGGGIGAGIAEALVSTQTGLVVAVPGLFLGALLTRRQNQLEDELDQLVDLIVAQGANP